MRLSVDKGNYVFEFPTKSESERFLASVSAAMDNLSLLDNEKDKINDKVKNEIEKGAKNAEAKPSNLGASVDEDYKPSSKPSPRSLPPLFPSPFVYFSSFNLIFTVKFP